MKEFDYVIIGGGCAGLSLAYELEISNKLKDKTLAIIELREEYKRDKTWSFWKVFDHSFEDCVIKSWNNFTINTSEGSQELKNEKYPYQSIDSGKFYEKENKLKINQWLMAQMGSIGPFIGQYHFFYKFNKGLSEVGEKRYYEMTKKVYEVLENHLSKNNYLAGENYSIADIATWPWIARHEWHDIGLKNYDNLCDWYIRIADRPAVVKGYKFLDKNSEIPKP